MKIYKDILESLGIINVSLLYKGKNFFCMPLDISGNLWEVVIDGDFTINGIGKLCITRKFDTLEFSCAIETEINDVYSIYSCIHKLTIGFSGDNETEIKFQRLLREFEKDQIMLNKRKEERYEIKGNIKGIRFDKIEQKLVTTVEELPCLVDNLSLGGAKVITYNSYFPIGSLVCLYLSFIEPIEQIPLKATVRYVTVKKNTIKAHELAILSMEFERASIAYQNRIKRLIEYNNHEKKGEK